MTVKLKTQLVVTWPKLAWVARFLPGQNAVEVMRGQMVEVADEWCVEAVWSGEFADGGFDQTDLVFGSGVRCRNGTVVFVSAGTMLDRLWYCQHEGYFFVSNSLPALLALANLSLKTSDVDYPKDIQTMRDGLNRYKRTIPTESSDIHVLYHRNLIYDGKHLEEVDKPNSAPDFTCYADYHGYLVNTARSLKVNLSSHRREHRIVPLSTISSGYDSGAAAVLAREAGCRDAATIVNSSSMLQRNDSGLEIAKHLGLNCRAYRHTPRAYRNEAAVWAAAGQPSGLNVSIFDYPKPLCIFFTGYRGDVTWSRRIEDRCHPFSTIAIDGLGLCEFRLVEGFFHCPVPFWGSIKADQIQSISFHKEMETWTLHNRYDRPIPRRILEDAGVPRSLFGRRKEHTAADMFFYWPFTPESTVRFGTFLSDRRIYAPSRSMVWLLRKLAHVSDFARANINQLLGWNVASLRHWPKLNGQSLVFQWANDELRGQYAEALQASTYQRAVHEERTSRLEGG